MQIPRFPFAFTDWSTVASIDHPGETGVAHWRTQEFAGIRVRLVDYSPGYKADHWCSKGHILFCLEGQLDTELADGRSFTLKAGTSYQCADNTDPHRSSTVTGARLFIVD